jgi:hypothetical protein
MRSRLAIATTVAAGLVFAVPGPTLEADESTVSGATQQVESGAKKIGQGVEETAKGIGDTVEKGAKVTGEKLKEAGEAAEPQAKSGWAKVKDGAYDFGQSVKRFFTR